MNKRSDIFSRLDDSLDVLNQLRSMLTNLNDQYKYKSLSSILDLMKNDIDFFNLIIGYLYDQFPKKDYLKFGIKKEEEVKKLGDLIRNLDLSDENQTMAFKNIAIYEIFQQEIVKVTKFTLNGTSKLINNLRSTNTMYYDVVLPFHDKNYDPTSTECTRAINLPSFFIR